MTYKQKIKITQEELNYYNSLLSLELDECSPYYNKHDIERLGGKTDDEKVDNLIRALQEIKSNLKIALSMKDGGIKKEDLENALKNGLAEEAFDDQSTGANPRYPLISELEQLYWKAYEGETDFDI